MIRIAIAATGAVLMAGSAQAQPQRDPLESPTWQGLAASLFGTERVHFDDRVKVEFPAIAEDQHSFPVTVDARGIAGVKRILLFADLNPIPLAIDYSLEAARPYLAARIKLDQRTPVRGAVQLADGSWLVNGGWIDAAGGGCSAPPASRVKGDWAEHLGEMRGIALNGADGTRIRLAFRHPMDTGFVANIPSYHIEHVGLVGAQGRHYGDMQIEASVAEDPAITTIAEAATGEEIKVAGNDTNGIGYEGRLKVAEAPAAFAVR